jgi:hypothetical protein
MAISKKLTTLFIRELVRRGISAPKAQEDGRFLVEINDDKFTVSLENLAKEFARDHDAGRVARFVDAILATSTPALPWPQAQAGVRFSAEPSDHDFGDTLYDPITDSLCRVLTYVDEEESRITWLTPSMLEEWGKSRDAVAKAAGRNMAELLQKTPIEIEAVEQFQLGMFATHSPFKASLIFSPNLKDVLSPKLGWPVYAVIPCRDFAYVFREEDQELIPRLGQVVVREFTRSAYPISTEVFRISNEGIEAVGYFPAESN